ncbi:MAG: CinA family protein, partial [Bacteroidales bacterium]|nr:CinA family protein [Bacteroidales bacterium]
FKGGITTYLSENPFNLPFSEITGENGEVTVRAMAESVKKLYSSDHSIATLEISGSVLIAVAGPDVTVVEKILPGDNKERNIIRISQTALHILRRMLINKQ